MHIYIAGCRAWSNKDLTQDAKPSGSQKRFAHKGVVIAARELAYQLDEMPYDDDVHAPHRDSIGGTQTYLVGLPSSVDVWGKCSAMHKPSQGASNPDN